MSSTNQNTKVVLGVPGPIDQVSNTTTGQQIKIVVKSGSSTYEAILTVPDDVKIKDVMVEKAGNEIFIKGPASKTAGSSLSNFNTFSTSSVGVPAMAPIPIIPPMPPMPAMPPMPPMPDFNHMFGRNFWA